MGEGQGRTGLDFCFDVCFILEQKVDLVGDWILVPRLLHEKDTHTSWKKTGEWVICLGGSWLSTWPGKGQEPVGIN